LDQITITLQQLKTLGIRHCHFNMFQGLPAPKSLFLLSGKSPLTSFSRSNSGRTGACGYYQILFYNPKISIYQ